VAQDTTEDAAGRAPFKIGDWLVEPDLDRITRDGVHTTLRPRVTELLVCLADRAGELATKQYLIDRVWQTEFVTVNALTQLIAELRRALGDDAGHPRYVETIPRRGYRLVAETTKTAVANEPAPEDRIRVSLIDENGIEIELTARVSTIGRAADAEVRIDSSRVSRRHARIVIEASTATLEDLGSKNGTRLRGRRIDGAATLEDADEIQIGADLARFRVRILDELTRTETRND
jgi:DNA-binding winged helix-turn-helix (wHTH) protein